MWSMFVVCVVAAILPAVFLVSPHAQAQGVTAQTLSQYLDRMGVSWNRSDKDANVLLIGKTTGLKKAERVDMVITLLPTKDLVTIRAFPKSGGKYLALATVRNREAMMKSMLENNATAFGAYIVDDDGDIGFRYVFTTESGLGFEAFKVAVNELLRIADEPIMNLYAKYR
jgi:hypothetical protein